MPDPIATEAPPEPTTEPTPTQEPSQDAKTGGSSDNWYAPEHYLAEEELQTLPTHAREKLAQTLKEMQGNYTRKSQEFEGLKGLKKQVEESKYVFKDAKDIIDAVKNNPNLQTELSKLTQEEQQKEQSLQSGAEYMDEAIQLTINGRLTRDQIGQYLETLSSVEKVTFQNAVKQEIRERQERKNQFENLDQKNKEKYGDEYESVKPKFSEVFNTVKSNPGEVAFRFLDYESNYKRGYEAGLKERGASATNLRNLAGVGNTNTGSVKGTKPMTAQDAMMEALREQNWSDDDIANHFGR